MHEHRSLFVDGYNGWGNRNRVLTFAITLAVATGRVLLLDSHKAEPFFPLVFRPPFSPWLTDGARLTNLFHTKSVGALEIRANYRRKSNGFKCWEKLHSLCKCGLSKSVPMLKVQGIYDLSAVLAADHTHFCLGSTPASATRAYGECST